MADITSPNASTTGRGFSTAAAIRALLAILVVSCLVDAFFFTGFYGSDDASYLDAARRVLEDGKLAPLPAFAHIRLTILGWNALIGGLLGFNIQLIAGSYVFFHQLLNVLTFMLGRRLFDNTVALLATFCLAMVPLAVTFSTAVLPDLPMSCFLIMSLLLFLASYDLREGGKTVRGLIAIFSAALCVGLAYMAKEAALVALPFYLVLWLCREDWRNKRVALTAGMVFFLGLVTIFLTEWGVLSYLTGHSYIRMGWTAGAPTFPTNLYDYPYGYYPLERLECIASQLEPWFSKTIMGYLLLGTVLVYPLMPGRRLSIWALAVWYFVYHTWGSTRLSEYLPPPLQARYFTPLLPLLLLAYAYIAMKICRAVIGLIKNRGLRRGMGIVLGVLLVAHPLPTLHTSDLMAGKIFRADIVYTSYAAILDGLAVGNRPVVPSGTVTNHLEPLLQSMTSNHLLLRSEDYNSLAARRRMLADGFYYVEVYPPDYLAVVKQPAALDRILHPSLPALDDGVEPWIGQQQLSLGPLKIDGRPGVLHRLRRFDLPYRRSEAITHLINPLSRCRADRRCRSAYLYEWVPLTE